MNRGEDKATDAVLAVAALGFPWGAQDPFLFCAYHVDAYPAGNEKLGPAASLAGRDMGQDFAGKDGWRMYHGQSVPGFPQHPHRGFETVTLVRRGLLDHSDSIGGLARFGHGDVQWLTTGKGILHSEMFPLVNQSEPNPAELFQIWLNLPRVSKLVEPHFTMFWGEDVPKETFRDEESRTTEVTVVAGVLGNVRGLPPPPNSWAAREDAHVAIWTIKLAPGARWVLPPAPATNRTLYFFRGSSLTVSGHRISGSHAVILRDDVPASIENGPEESELLLLQGRPLNEPIAQHGPFVMNTQEEIRRAFSDFQRTQFGGWPWPSHEPVHAREENRFARHPDGRLERPRP